MSGSVWIIQRVRYYRDIDNYPASEVLDADVDGWYSSYARARELKLALNGDLPPVYPDTTDFTIYEINEIEESPSNVMFDREGTP